MHDYYPRIEVREKRTDGGETARVEVTAGMQGPRRFLGKDDGPLFEPKVYIC